MKRYLFFLFAAFLLTSCHGDPPMIGQPVDKQQSLKENMINANRTIAHAEETSIDEYISRRNWPMTKLSDGARIWVYETGKGDKVEIEDSVTIRYNVEAINGKNIYDYNQDTYVAGHRRDLIGLDGAVMGLNRGSKAKVILPSNLAFGIGGDGDRIPQSAILVIDLQIIN